MNKRIQVETTPSSPVRAVLRLLGPFSLQVNGEDCSDALGYDRVRLLLAALALAPGEPWTRADLAAMIWPQEPISTGRTRLRHALHTLRTVLADLPQALNIDATRVALQPDAIEVDVLAIVKADAQAFGQDDVALLSFYGGRFLEGVKFPGGDDFQSWYGQWDTRIEIAVVSSRNRLVEQHIQAGEFASILDQVQEWVTRWPADEVCHRHRIRLLLELGQRDAALSAYEHCVAAMARHAGTTPSVETRTLLGLAQQPSGSMSFSNDKQENSHHGYRPLAVLAIALGWSGESVADPEEAIAHMQSARRRVLEILLALGVWIPQPDDSTLLAYFGYPAGSEHPLAQAVVAARLLARTEFDPSIQLGIGLHADIALTGPGSRPDVGGVLSQTALSLAWQAGHHEVRLSQEAVARLESHEVLRGRAGSISLLQLQKLPAQPQRMHGRGLEFDNLIQQWARLVAGRPPVSIQLSGPAGIGKSLMVQALGDYVTKTGGEAITLVCEENGRDMPWRPLLCWLQDVVIAPRDPVAGQEVEPGMPVPRQLLQKRFALAADDAQELANMMHVREVVQVQHEAQSSYKAAVAVLTGRVRATAPLLLVLENMHWADGVTLELFKHLAARSCPGPVMILVTTRDAREVSWLSRHLVLAPLPRDAMTELVNARARPERVSRALRMEIVDQSQGIPRYALALLQQAVSQQVLGHAPQVSDSVCAWVNQSGKEVRAVLIAAALCEHVISVKQLQQVLDLSRPKAEHAVRLLVRLFLLTLEDRELYCPVLVRQAVMRMSSRAERAQTHERLAQYFIQATGNVQEIAYHLRSWQDQAAGSLES